MRAEVFKPTTQQDKVIHHGGSAFITACPGAGKTRVMVERAREILHRNRISQHREHGIHIVGTQPAQQQTFGLENEISI